MSSELRSLFPNGSSLSDADFDARHRLILRVLWVQISAAVGIGVVNGGSLVNTGLKLAPVVALAVLAAVSHHRPWKSMINALALLGGCGVMIHLTHGLGESHMLLLVALVVVALYQDWRAYALGVGFTVVHHVGMSMYDPASVFSHADARQRPVMWALIHTAIVAFESGVIMVFWKHAGDAQRREIGLRALLFREESDIHRRMAELERKRAEDVRTRLHNETGIREMFGAVLEAIPNPVWWRDADMMQLGANSAHQSLRLLVEEATRQGPEDPRYRNVASAFADLDEMLESMERQVLLEGRAVQDVHVKIPNADGSIGTFLFDVLPYRLAGNEASGIIGVATEITHVSQLEAQLAQASRLESIGQLAAGVAHEINTPIQFVSDNTRFLVDGFAPMLEVMQVAAAVVDGSASVHDLARVVEQMDVEFIGVEVPAALDQSLEGLQRVSDIVRAMKDYAHPGQGRALTDINRAIESTIKICRNEWKYVAEVELVLDPSVGLLPCFEGELKQALLNMVVNAAHAIEERRQATGEQALGHIRVATRRLGTEVEVVIADDGAGMDEATARRIFDPFFTTKQVGKGTGQGLSLAHATIVHKHGGRIRVDSVVQRGSAFTITLPDIERDGAVASTAHVPAGSFAPV